MTNVCRASYSPSSLVVTKMVASAEAAAFSASCGHVAQGRGSAASASTRTTRAPRSSAASSNAFAIDSFARSCTITSRSLRSSFTSSSRTRWAGVDKPASIACVDDDDEDERAPVTRNVGEEDDVDVDGAPWVLEEDKRASAGGGGGELDTREGAGVCPVTVSTNGGGPGGKIEARGKRTVCAFGDAADGIGVGLRKPGTGVGLRAMDGACGVTWLSLGGSAEGRLCAPNGCDVGRLSGGGIVDLRVDEGVAEGGSGVSRPSDGGTVDRRDDTGNTDERPDAASSSPVSSISPLRGSTAGIFVDERRDEPRAELCG